MSALTAGLRPGDREIADLTAGFGFDQQSERLQDDPPLHFAVKGWAELVPHHERDEYRSGRLGVLRDVSRYRDRYGRNASSLDGALNQRDRLVSYGSGGGCQDQVGSLRHDFVGDLFGQC